MAFDTDQCIICGTFYVSRSYSKLYTESYVVQEDIYNSWNNECAKATCEVLFDDKSAHFIKYFQDAEYCSFCQQLVRDICFTWKQLKLFQNTIDKLSVKMYKLIELNYQKIPDKFDVNVVEVGISRLFNTSFTVKTPKLSHDELLQMIYRVANKNIQKIYNYNMVGPTDAEEIIIEASSDDEINSQLEENSEAESNSDMESNSNNPKPRINQITIDNAKEKCNEVLTENADEEEGYELVEVTSGSEDEDSDNNDSVIKQSTHSNLENASEFQNCVTESRNIPAAQPCYQCDVCGLVFSQPKYLKRHEKKIHEDEKYLLFKCSFCVKKFELESSLVVHIEKHHEQSTSCEVCNRSFTTFVGLRAHQGKVHRKYEYKCSVCDKSFPSFLKGKNHEQSHSKAQEPIFKEKNTFMFECKYCAKGYNSEEELNSHYSEAHQWPNPFCCAFCPKIFNNSVDLQRHMKFNHPEPGSLVKELKCDVCDRYFRSRYNLKNHQLKHGDPSLMLKCELCPAVFPMRSGLNSHLKCHISERKFVCEKCGKAFKTFTALRTHSRYHGEKNIQCKFCDKKFFKNSHRKTHEIIVHTNVKDHVCQVCGKAFNHRGNLKGHLRLHESKGEM